MKDPAAAILKQLTEQRAVDARVMIVVAHPDDETIGMGAQLCRLQDALLVQVTDGAPRDGRDAAAHGFANIREYAFERRVELRAALEAGGAGALSIENLGIPDQEACYNLTPLIRCLQRRLREAAPEVVFVQAYEGGHPDHDAAAFAIAVAERLIAAEGDLPPTVVEMAAYHADGPGLATGIFLPGGNPVMTLELNAADRLRKRRMIDCFASQRDLLAGFDTKLERFRKASRYDFTRPPHSGELHYERLGWSITGELWRRCAQDALEMLGIDARTWA